MNDLEGARQCLRRIAALYAAAILTEELSFSGERGAALEQSAREFVAAERAEKKAGKK